MFHSFLTRAARALAALALFGAAQLAGAVTTDEIIKRG